MKLLTHNLLSSKCMKGVMVGFPLGIKATEIKETQVDYNPEFVTRIIPRLDWEALCQAAESIGCNELPHSLKADFENDPEFLKKVHHVLLEMDVVTGELICPETNRSFRITNGIPNMLLNEDEV